MGSTLPLNKEIMNFKYMLSHSLNVNMLRKKGDHVAIGESLWLMVLVIIAIIIIVSVSHFMLGGEPGCERYDGNPRACIGDGECHPVINFAEGEYGEDIACKRAMRRPNEDFNAARDPRCFCPDDYEPVYDEDSRYYGMCLNQRGGEDYIVRCYYTLEYPHPKPENVDKCNGRNYGEVWDGNEYCCDNGNKLECGDDADYGETCVGSVCVEDADERWRDKVPYLIDSDAWVPRYMYD